MTPERAGSTGAATNSSLKTASEFGEALIAWSMSARSAGFIAVGTSGMTGFLRVWQAEKGSAKIKTARGSVFFMRGEFSRDRDFAKSTSLKKSDQGNIDSISAA